MHDMVRVVMVDGEDDGRKEMLMVIMMIVLCVEST